MRRLHVAAPVATVLLALMPASAAPYWVFLDSKLDARGSSVAASDPTWGDTDVDAGLVERVRATGATLRHRSRWFNAVSVEADERQLQRLRSLAFVTDVRPVASLIRPPAPDSGLSTAPRRAGVAQYGDSFDQVAAVGAHLLHARDIRGEGVRVAVLDAGFNWRSHRAFAQLDVLAERDFLNLDDDVGDETDEPMTGNEVETGQNEHGTAVLGVLAGDAAGQLVGIAPGASYLLAKTEDTRVDDRGDEVDSKTEEDRWIAALEWADSLGAQVVNSSLGWTTFDDAPDYTYDDVDGATAMTTVAAEMAVARGIVMVVSAGNEARTDWHYITPPADGPNTIAVGAVNPFNYGIAFFSSRGPTADGRIKPDVVAPGQQVVTVTGGSAAEPFSIDTYRRANGTSFAAPIVSGAAALLLQIHPQWTPAQVAEALRSTATDLGPAGADTLFGWGLVNVARASGLGEVIPEETLVQAPYPNPARGRDPVVYFPVALSAADELSLSLFDVSGALVDAVDPVALPAGEYVDAGLAPSWPIPADLADGVYYYVLTGRELERTGKIAILRGE